MKKLKLREISTLLQFTKPGSLPPIYTLPTTHTTSSAIPPAIGPGTDMMPPAWS